MKTYNNGSNIIYFDSGFKYFFFEKSFFDKDGNKIKLSTQEIRLIEYLLKNHKEYRSYRELQDIISVKTQASMDTLRTLIKNIRQKTYRDIILNLSGIGYKLNLKDSYDLDCIDDKINILICDDQKTNLEFLKILILKNFKNAKVLLASGGKEAIDILKDNVVNIILLDIQMPEVDGWQVAEFIQKELKEQNIAIIFITSFYLDDEFEKKGFELGAVDYMTTPLNKNQLVNRLRLYIRNFLNERIILDQHIKNRQKDKLILQKEVRLAQVNILEKISHHWRQPLSLISSGAGAMQLLLMAGKDDKNFMLDSCRSIISTTKELSSIIEDFKTFFKPVSIREIFNLKSAIKDTVSIMSLKFKENKIKLKLELEDIGYDGYENEFKQVLISLFNNSLEAVAQNQNEDFRFIKIKLDYKNNYEKNKKIQNIEISIIDNGGGVDASIQDKIYEPYFSTKHGYSGTGLSLHLAQELMQRYFNAHIANQNINYIFENKKYNCANFKINLTKG